jgi:predicted RNase H-like nuclease (RuvC/YqgF family)
MGVLKLVKVASVETKKHSLDNNIQELNCNFENLDARQENIRDELEKKAIHLDRNTCSTDVCSLDKRIHMLKLNTENVRNNLRVFGLPDNEEEHPQNTST